MDLVGWGVSAGNTMGWNTSRFTESEGLGCSKEGLQSARIAKRIVLRKPEVARSDGSRTASATQILQMGPVGAQLESSRDGGKRMCFGHGSHRVGSKCRWMVVWVSVGSTVSSLAVKIVVLGWRESTVGEVGCGVGLGFSLAVSGQGFHADIQQFLFSVFIYGFLLCTGCCLYELPLFPVIADMHGADRHDGISLGLGGFGFCGFMSGFDWEVGSHRRKFMVRFGTGEGDIDGWGSSLVFRWSLVSGSEGSIEVAGVQSFTLAGCCSIDNGLAKCVPFFLLSSLADQALGGCCSPGVKVF
ncbi:hypothetical protein Dimus_025243 [Dionaea muscipula]